MIVFCFLSIVIFVLFIMLFRTEYKSCKGLVLGLCSVFAVLIGLLFTLVVSMIAIGFFPIESYTEEKSIVSLRDQVGIHGSFCLGTGVLGSSTYYISYIKLGDGGYQQIKINSDKCKIYEDNDLDPKLVYIKKKYKRSWMYIVFDVFQIVKNKTWIDSYELHVPHNTIYKIFIQMMNS